MKPAFTPGATEEARSTTQQFLGRRTPKAQPQGLATSPEGLGSTQLVGEGKTLPGGAPAGSCARAAPLPWHKHLSPRPAQRSSRNSSAPALSYGTSLPRPGAGWEPWCRLQPRSRCSVTLCELLRARARAVCQCCRSRAGTGAPDTCAAGHTDSGVHGWMDTSPCQALAGERPSRLRSPSTSGAAEPPPPRRLHGEQKLPERSTARKGPPSSRAWEGGDAGERGWGTQRDWKRVWCRAVRAAPGAGGTGSSSCPSVLILMRSPARSPSQRWGLQQPALRPGVPCSGPPPMVPASPRQGHILGGCSGVGEAVASPKRPQEPPLTCTAQPRAAGVRR